MPRHLLRLLLQALFACWSLAAGARELEWRALDVDARLDDEGRLHVSERHEMVFTGDWNGGERRFRVVDDHSLVIKSIARLDVDGSWVPLEEGSLDVFDQYRWVAREHALRWRVKRPSDGDFDHTAFVHRIDYMLSRVLESEGRGNWNLDHDFAFRERPGEIERFRLRLALDGSWQSEQPSPLELERGPLPPGQSVQVRLQLHYTGTQLQDPPNAWTLAWEWLTEVRMSLVGQFRRLLVGLTVDVRLWVAALFSTLLGGLAQALFQRTREPRNSASLLEEADIDAAWIEEHILPHAPEVVGAAYERVIGSAEVMAVLARLEREGKLTSTVEEHQLALRLCVPRDAFVDHERELIDKLFFAGDQTSTALIRSHYENFDPAKILSRSLSPKVDAVLGTTHRDPEKSPYPVKLTACVAGGAFLFTSSASLQRWFPSWGEGAGFVMIIGLAGAVAIGAVRARRFRDGSELMLDARFLRRWFVAFGAVVVALALLAPHMSPLDFAMHFGGAFTLALLVVWSGWPRESAAGAALRQRIAEARRYFQAQLRTRQPQLDDAWYPYMIALGLSPELDSWFAAFGSEPQRKEPEERDERSSPSASSVAFDSATSSSTGDAEPARWTGGGGRFGGGGASGSWGSAAAGLASGVSTPSSPSSSSPSSSSGSYSSSGSSSSSESTSRSGGGSGGGW